MRVPLHRRGSIMWIPNFWKSNGWNEAQGFFIQDIHLKKLTEEVLGISLKEKKAAAEKAVLRYGELLTLSGDSQPEERDLCLCGRKKKGLRL